MYEVGKKKKKKKQKKQKKVPYKTSNERER